MKEKEFKKIIRGLVPAAHWQPIESWQIAAGIPDLNGCLRGVEVWVEAKIAWGNKVNLTALQTNWLNQRSAAGGRCYIAVAVKQELWIYHGFRAREVREHGLKRPPNLIIDHYNAKAIEGFLFGVLDRAPIEV